MTESNTGLRTKLCAVGMLLLLLATQIFGDKVPRPKFDTETRGDLLVPPTSDPPEDHDD